MPKVYTKSLRSLASKCNPSILTGAITESADYIDELEEENKKFKNDIEHMNNVIGDNKLSKDDLLDELVATILKMK
jgi:hypothetical protein